MKKFLVILLALLMCLSVVACDTKKKNKDDDDEEETSTEETSCKKALELIEEGKYEEAYKELYAIRSDEEAAKLLQNFKVLHKKEVHTESRDDFVNEHTIEYSYDKNGNVIKRVETSSSEMASISEYVYDYDEDGRIVKITSNSRTQYYDRGESVVEYKYDENGRVTNVGAITYEYDKSGNLKKVSLANEAKVYYYDNNGKLIKKEELQQDEVFGTYTYYYDNERINKVVSVRNTGNGKSNTEYEYTYNENGKLAACKVDDSRDEGGNICFTYDENGNLIKADFEIEADESMAIYGRYTYDSVGNLTSLQERMGTGVEDIKYSDFVYFYLPENKMPEIKDFYDSPDSFLEITPENPIE